MCTDEKEVVGIMPLGMLHLQVRDLLQAKVLCTGTASFPSLSKSVEGLASPFLLRVTGYGHSRCIVACWRVAPRVANVHPRVQSLGGLLRDARVQVHFVRKDRSRLGQSHALTTV